MRRARWAPLGACLLGTSVALIAIGCSANTHSAGSQQAVGAAATATTALATSEAGGPQPFRGPAQGAVCRSEDLALHFGAFASPKTGQHPLPLVLVNLGSAPCHLDGYPRVALLDARGQVLPFVYRHGGDQMVTSNPPHVVNLPPGGAAYILTNKYRCDLGDKAAAVSVQVTPPANASSMSMSVEGVSDLAFCGAGDPGSTLAISPVEPDDRATFAD